MPFRKNSVLTRRVAVVGASLVVLAIAGCGSSSSTPSGLSKSALVKQGDAICMRHTEVITAAASKLLAGGKLPSPAKFGQLAFGTIIPQTTTQISELSALKPEAKLASSYKQWLASLRAALAGMKQNPASIQQRAPFVTVNHQAKALGFSSACNVGPGS